MVWGLFPIDPLPGEDNYYFFKKGTYKVGRKGCDVIINKDKGVSRIHAEILIDEMSSMDHSLKKPSVIQSKVRVRDCSKYGTFLNRNLDSKEKVHEFPNKETPLKDGDLVSFGTGNATYRFSYVPFIFFICSLKHSKTNQLITKKVSSIGASITKKWSSACSHVLVDDSFPLSDDLIDAIVARKPFVQYSWVELIAGKNVCTEIPICSSHAPKLMLEGVSVKVVDPESRECCLKGYAFLLEPENKYKFEGRLKSLLEVGGANVSSEMVSQKDGNDRVVCVVPAGSSNFKCFSNQSSLPWVSEIDLVSAVLSGYLDPSIITSPPGECGVSLEFDFSLHSTCRLAFCVHKFLFSPFLYFFALSCSLASPLKFWFETFTSRFKLQNAICIGFTNYMLRYRPLTCRDHHFEVWSVINRTS